MKAYGGVDVQIHIFLTSALAGGEWSASRPFRFIPGETASDSNWIGGWLGPSASMDDVEKRKWLTLPGLELWTHSRPAHSQSLYRLRYQPIRFQSRNSAMMKNFQSINAHAVTQNIECKSGQLESDNLSYNFCCSSAFIAESEAICPSIELAGIKAGFFV
jgi:hypothetical protein